MEEGVAVSRIGRSVLDRSIALLQAAKEKDGYTREAIEAVYFTRRLWIRFIEDLRAPGQSASTKSCAPTSFRSESGF